MCLQPTIQRDCLDEYKSRLRMRPSRPSTIYFEETERVFIGEGIGSRNPFHSYWAVGFTWILGIVFHSAHDNMRLAGFSHFMHLH